MRGKAPLLVFCGLSRCLPLMTYVERSLVRSVLGFVRESKEHICCLVCMFEYSTTDEVLRASAKKTLKVNVIPGQSSLHKHKEKYNFLVKGANWT